MRRRVEKLADGPVLDRPAARPGQGGTTPDDNLDASRLNREQARDNRAGDNQAGDDQRWGDQPWNYQYRDERDRPARGIMLGMAIGATAWVLIGLAVLTWWS